MKGTMRLILSLVVVLALVPVSAVAQRLDMNTFENPIEPLDSVWIEDLTMIEVRDYIKEGKTNALILTGGIEQNGPYLVTGKHNYVLRAMGESIAREMGNTLVVPIVTLEPGNPEGDNVPPGTVYLSPETYRAVLRDAANSLKSQGFTNIFMMGDSGGNQTPMSEVAEELTEKWGMGSAHVYFIPEYYQNGMMRTFITKELGIEEVFRGPPRRVLHRRDDDGRRSALHPNGTTDPGRQVLDQWREPATHREDARECAQDHRLPDRVDRDRDEESNGGGGIKPAVEGPVRSKTWELALGTDSGGLSRFVRFQPPKS